MGFSTEVTCANVERDHWRVYGRHFRPRLNPQSRLWADELESIAAVRERLQCDPDSSGSTVDEEQSHIFRRMNDGELTKGEAVAALVEMHRRGF